VGLVNFVKERLNGREIVSSDDACAMERITADVFTRELAFRTAVNLVARAVSKCEFKTYQDGKEIKGSEYYRWNVEPNMNQNSSVFLTKLITKLYENNEALVIVIDSELTGKQNLLVADSYSVEKFALREYLFTGVMVDGLAFNRSFRQSEVFYFRLNNENVKRYLDGLQVGYGELIEYAKKAYKKSRGMRGIFTANRKPTGNLENEQTFANLMKARWRDFFENDNAVMSITTGETYTDIGSKTYSSDSTRDIRNLIDDNFVFAARAIGFPPSLILGDVADVSNLVDSFLTFCIDPLCDMISEEITRKKYGEKSVLNGSRLVIDTKTMKHIDLLSVANSIDKLIASGVWSINEIRKYTGEERIEEDWADKHWITKNYEEVQKAQKAGER